MCQNVEYMDRLNGDIEIPLGVRAPMIFWAKGNIHAARYTNGCFSVRHSFLMSRSTVIFSPVPFVIAFLDGLWGIVPLIVYFSRYIQQYVSSALRFTLHSWEKRSEIYRAE